MNTKDEGPDYAIILSGEYPANFWPGDFCRRLKEDYSLDVDLGTLTYRLEDAGLAYLSAGKPKLTPDDNKRHLLKLAVISGDLDDAIQSLHLDLLRNLGRQGLSLQLLNDLRATLSLVKSASRVAISNVPTFHKPTGAKKHLDKHLYVQMLLQIIDDFATESFTDRAKARFILECSVPLEIYPQGLPDKTKIQRIYDIMRKSGKNS
jgi:hypothetical protein